MTHSIVLLNDGSKLLLNDGSSFLLLNQSGEEHGRTGFGGVFGRLRKRPQQEQLTVTEFSKLLIARPFMLRDFALALARTPFMLKKINLLLTFKSLSVRIASKPIHGINLIKIALMLDQPKTFEFSEDAKEWSKAGLDDREKSFTLQSSFVGKVTYTPEFNSMEITLNGQVYGFCNVPERIYDSFKGASSKGAYFVRTVKGNYDC